MKLIRYAAVMVLFTVLIPLAGTRSSSAAMPLQRREKVLTTQIDDFGYLADFAPTAWLETPDAAAAPLFQPVSLGFAFKFYDKTFESVNIEVSDAGINRSTSARLSFKQGSQGATSFIKANFLDGWEAFVGDTTYKAGGAAPNRYFLVQWLGAKLVRCPHGCFFSNPFDAQIILQENGDIVVHFRGISPEPNVLSLEMSDWTALETPFIYLPRPAGDLASLRVIRPPAQARMVSRPPRQAQLMYLSGSHTFTFTAQNQGDLGIDTFDVHLDSTWPISAYAADGVTPLTDTNGNGIMDTGALAQAEIGTFAVRLATPPGLEAGASTVATATLSSAREITRQNQVAFQVAVPAPFAATFVQEGRNDPARGFQTYSILAITEPAGQRLVKSTALPLESQSEPPSPYTIDPPSEITELPSGGYILARRFGTAQDLQIVYAMTDDAGEMIAPVRGISLSQLPTPNDTGYSIDQLGIKMAATPSGRIGLMAMSGSGFGTVGIFTLLDLSGQRLLPPTLFGAVSPDAPREYMWRRGIGLAATADNHFIWVYEDAISNDTAYLKALVLDDDGSVIRPEQTIAEVHPDFYCCDGQFKLAASGHHVFVAGFQGAAIDYLVLDALGQVTKPLTRLYSNSAIANPQGRQFLQIGGMAEARAGIVWMENRDMQTDSAQPSIQQTMHFAVVSADAAPILAPTAVAQLLPNTGLNEDYGLMAFPDSAGHLVVLWQADLNFLNYLLLDANGGVATPATRVDLQGFNPNRVLYHATTHNARVSDNANLSVRAPSQISVLPGGLATIPLRLMNSSLITATDLVLTVTLGTDVTYVSGITGYTPTITLSQNQTILVWHLPSADRLSESVAPLVVRGPGDYGTRVPLRVELSGSQFDAVPSDNTAQVGLWVSKPLYLPSLIHRPFY